MPILRKNVASQVIFFGGVSATTGAATAGLTWTGYVTKDAGSQASAGGSFSNLGNGQYSYAPTQAETNANAVGFFFVSSGYIPISIHCFTDVVDGNGYADVNLVDIAGNAVSTGAAQLGVNVVKYNNETAVTDGNNYPSVNLVDIAGSTVSTTIAQLGVNTVKYNNQTALTDANNLPKVDVEDWNATAVSSPATAGIPDVNVKNYNNHAATTDGNNYPKVGVTDWGGTAVTANPPDQIFIREGTAQAGGSTTITLDNGASATNNLYQNETIIILSGTGVGQSNLIKSYVGSTKVATVANSWATNPDNTSVFLIVGVGSANADIPSPITANVTQWNGHNVHDSVSGYPDTNVAYYDGQAAMVDGNNLPQVTAEYLGTNAQDDVHDAVVTALDSDTYAEPSSVPAATATLVDKIGFIEFTQRNEAIVDKTAGTSTVYADGPGSAVATSTISDNGTQFTRGQFG
jgi:hypothetical protein